MLRMVFRLFSILLIDLNSPILTMTNLIWQNWQNDDRSTKFKVNIIAVLTSQCAPWRVLLAKRMLV